MGYRVHPLIFAAAVLACSGSGDEPLPAPSGNVEVRPLTGSGEVPGAFVSFVDDATGFATEDVHDANREVVRFDAAQQTMVAFDTGDSVSGWVATGNDLSWSSSGVEFRVRFGTEEGERRAYFTETATGTICDLRLTGPDQLGISGTREIPPNP